MKKVRNWGGARYYVIARPDIIIDVVEAGDCYETGGVERIKRHHEILKPKLGSFVVSRGPLPKPPVVKTEEPGQMSAPVAEGSQPDDPFAGLPLDIRFIFAGYEADRLKPVIDAIAGFTSSKGE